METSVVYTYINLVLALLVFPLCAVWARRTFALTRPTIQSLLPLYVFICALVISVLLLVVKGEGRTLSSLGGLTMGANTFLYGGGLGVAGVFIFGAVGVLIERLGIPSYQPALQKLLVLPAAFRVFIAICSGVTEEVMFRGIGLNRLTELTGSGTVAIVTTIAIFSAAHYPNGRAGQTISAAILGGGFTVVYLFTDSLMLNIIAHVTMDILGYVIFPKLAEQRKNSQR